MIVYHLEKQLAIDLCKFLKNSIIEQIFDIMRLDKIIDCVLKLYCKDIVGFCPKGHISSVSSLK